MTSCPAIAVVHRTGGPFEHVDVDPRPADEHVDEQPGAVGRHRDVGPRLRVGVLGPHDRIVGPWRAEHVVVHGPVVLVARRVAGVGEPGAVGLPCHAAGPGVRDGFAEVAAVGGVEHPQHGVLAAAFARADGDQRSVGRGGEPVDGVRRVGGADGGIEQDDGWDVRVGRRAPGEQELLGAGWALEAEEALATHLHGQHDRPLHQRDEALVPPAPVGTGVERLTRVFVLGADPLPDLVGVAVLQPAVRVGDLDAVEDVDDVVAPRWRERRHRLGAELSLAPCWGACRGWPWTAAAGPSSSWSSST